MTEAHQKLIELAPSPAENNLSRECFELVSCLTPIVNVDLLILDGKSRVLFTWRDDELHGKGWHLPGGIVRFKETTEDRVKQVGKIELGAEVVPIGYPKVVAECRHATRKVRGHFISFLFHCELVNDGPQVIMKQRNLEETPGEIAWFSHCPKNLIGVQRFYEDTLAEVINMSSRNGNIQNIGPKFLSLEYPPVEGTPAEKVKQGQY
tara:strand:+ start:87 stop:707 length:621 start_codon:yes stop_codon:yes gene_type:complete